MFEDGQPWFRYLRALGKSQGFLTYAQVNNGLPLAIVDPPKIEEIVDRLKYLGVKVVSSRDEL
jgi:hypothetical protein